MEITLNEQERELIHDLMYDALSGAPEVFRINATHAVIARNIIKKMNIKQALEVTEF